MSGKIDKESLLALTKQDIAAMHALDLRDALMLALRTLRGEGQSSHLIETKQFGLMQHTTRPSTDAATVYKPKGSWEIRFDTGIVMLVPDHLIDNMLFHLEQMDPQPPKEGA